MAAAAAGLPSPGVCARADEGFLAFLRENLRHSDPQARAAAVALLGCLAGEAPATIAIESLAEAAEPEQEALAALLAQLPAAELQRLVPRLADPSPAVRLRLAQVCGSRELREAVPSLLSLLADRTGHVRAAAAVALGKIGDPVAAAPLVGFLRDPFPDVRDAGMAAIVALGGRGRMQRELILALIAPHFTAPQEALAAAAVRIAGSLGDRTLVQCAY